MSESTATAFYRYEDGEDGVRVTSPQEMDSLVNLLVAGDWEHQVAAVYHDQRPTMPRWGTPDHQFHIAVDPDARAGALRFAGDGGTWYSKGDTEQPAELCFYYMGHDSEYPADAEIPLDLVRQAAREFLTNGGHRPTCVDWQPFTPF